MEINITAIFGTFTCGSCGTETTVATKLGFGAAAPSLVACPSCLRVIAKADRVAVVEAKVNAGRETRIEADGRVMWAQIAG